MGKIIDAFADDVLCVHPSTYKGSQLFEVFAADKEEFILSKGVNE